jgi:hypothetical protein
VYDCGSSLYPLISDEQIPELLASESEIRQRIFTYPKASLIVRGSKASYEEILRSPEYAACREALARIYPRIDMGTALDIIESTEGLSENRRSFLKVMLARRYEGLLTPAFRGALSA